MCHISVLSGLSLPQKAWWQRQRSSRVDLRQLTKSSFLAIMHTCLATLLLCLIGGLAGDGRGGEGGGGHFGGGGGVVEEDEGRVANCTTRLMSAKMGHRQGYLSLYLILNLWSFFGSIKTELSKVTYKITTIFSKVDYKELYPLGLAGLPCVFPRKVINPHFSWQFLFTDCGFGSLWHRKVIIGKFFSWLASTTEITSISGKFMASEIYI